MCVWFQTAYLRLGTRKEIKKRAMGNCLRNGHKENLRELRLFKCLHFLRCLYNFRDKLDSDPNKKAVFSGYSTGPRIAGFVYDKHLDKIMKNAKKRVKVFD